MKAVIFDMDGVLIDTEPLNDLHTVEYLKNLGIKSSDKALCEYLQKFRGAHAKYTWAQIIKDFNLTTPIDELITDVRMSYIRYLSSLNLKPTTGITLFLKKLKKEKFTLAVASSAYHKRIYMLLDVCRLREYFDVVVSGDHVQHSKPDPEIYLKTAELLKKNPGECVVFEDAVNGLLAAKAAGMKVIGYQSGRNEQDLSQADVIINSFKKINPSVVKNL